MAKNDVRPCQNCHGQGMVRVERIVKGKSVWTTETCRACGGSGKITISTI